MGTRPLEILLVLLLLVVGAGVYLQSKNQQLQTRNQELLDRILVELERRPVAMAGDAAVTRHATEPSTSIAADHANTARPPDRQPESQVTIAPVQGRATPPTSTRPASNPPAPSTPSDSSLADIDPSLTQTAPTAPAPNPVDVSAEDEQRWQVVGPIVEKVIVQLIAGEYDPVLARLDPEMRVQLTKPQLAEVMDPYRQQHGEFKRFVGHVADRQVDPGSDVYKVDAELRDGFVLRFTVSLDRKQRISGLMLSEAGG